MISIIREKISIEELKKMAEDMFGSFVKAVLDTEKKIMAVNGELHADMEATLIEDGSNQKCLWGINIYPDKSEDEMIEFNSLINLKPSAGNRSRGVDNSEIRETIKKIVRDRITL